MTVYAKTPPANFDPNPAWDVSPISPHHSGAFNDIGHPDGTWSSWFGFGKVDAAAAVEEALRLLGGPPASSNTITKSSTPSKAIPDNNITGVTDVINVNEVGTVFAVKVDLDITHTYIGDLVIKLVSPRGTPAFLHERNGGSTKNILKTYDLQNAPTLTRFNGESTSGNWTLEVIDAANVDAGVLNKWTIFINTGGSQEIKLEESPGVTIPDNNPAGIERSLNVADNGTVKEMEVGIDITHTYISDLIINLVSPGGSVISLHNKTGVDADNIIKTYNFINTQGLQVLKTKQISGVWKLKISDVAGQDIGKLNKWSLKLVKE
jgi:subtilisin-like proprotein convertase family protein